MFRIHQILPAALGGLLTTLGSAQSSTAPAPAAERVVDLDTFTVTAATRAEKQLSAIPQTISIVFEEDLREQLAISGDLIGAISQIAPAYSPSRQKMTGFGETFRGRSPLFMIDGVPQSNPLRDGSRDGYTIDPAMIERIELVHGASAAQGMGATGGIINYVTKDAPESDGTEQWMQVGFSTSDELQSEGLGYRGAYRLGHRSGDLGVLAAVAYEWRPMAYDGNGDLVGIDNTQGDTMNSHSLDVYGKLHYRLTEEQSVVAAVNRFEMKQDLDYISVGGDHAAGIPTTSIEGDTPGKATTNEVVTASATYRHDALLEGILTVDLFAQDFAATYGGGEFGVFQFNGETIFDQSENQSEKHGAKLTFVRDLPALADLGVVTGLDYLADSTQQVLVQTGRQWVPETTYRSWAPYLQLDLPVGLFSLTSGVRYESAELEVDDFRTLEAYGAPLVTGGSPAFDELLTNLGATYRATEQLTLFASYAQGFGMPDVGRVLRGVNQTGQGVDEFLDLQPIVTDNYELGLRWGSDRLRGSASAFWSTSDFGSRLVPDADGIFSVSREKTEIWGFEADLRFELTDADTIGGAFAWVEGESDTDGDGQVDTRLGGTNIPPPRLNLYWNHQWTPQLRTRLQTATYFDRDDPRDRAAFDFDGYTLFDLLVVYELPIGSLSAALENVFDEQYLTYYSQTAGNNSRNFAGRGRTLSVRYTVEF
ncbi:MAG: TonB-dependent receptor [Opitutales bacterium]